ncbi:MAG: ferredoxin [Geobacteraceae bacterium GWC2_48_7]|nr:MAG: ferredoxin [Geobacteraceae bacterium GWC2_48_7]
MSLDIAVHEQSCRGCELCIDICPTKVFELDEEKSLCVVKHVEDCIACLSCAYICPSNAISHTDYHAVKNFYRDAQFCQRMGKFL